MNISLMVDFIRAYFFSKRAHGTIRKISWISFTSLTLSVTALILVLSIMKALNQRVQSRLLDVEPHLVVHFESKDLSDEVIQSLPLSKKIQQMPFKKSFLSETQDLILRTWNGRFHGAIATGMAEQDLQWFLQQSGELKVAGSFYDLDLGEVLLGADLADILGVFPGDVLFAVLPSYLLEAGIEIPRLQRLGVGGTLRTQVSQIDAGTIFYATNGAEGIMASNPQKTKMYYIWLENPHDSSHFKQELLPLAQGRIETWQERNASIFYALVLERTMIGVFLSLAVIVAAFSLLMALVLLLSHKRREFGLLGLLGMSPKDLKQLFWGLGIGLGGGGISLGVIVGALGACYLEWFPLRVLPDIYYDNEITASLDWVVVGWVLGVGLILVTLASRFISRLIYKQDISAVMR